MFDNLRAGFPGSHGVTESWSGGCGRVLLRIETPAIVCYAIPIGICHDAYPGDPAIAFDSGP